MISLDTIHALLLRLGEAVNRAVEGAARAFSNFTFGIDRVHQFSNLRFLLTDVMRRIAAFVVDKPCLSLA